MRLVAEDAWVQAVHHEGVVITDNHCQTNIEGIFAIGEIAQRMHPCTATSMADGVVAAKAIQRSLEKDGLNKFIALTRRISKITST